MSVLGIVAVAWLGLLAFIFGPSIRMAWPELRRVFATPKLRRSRRWPGG